MQYSRPPQRGAAPPQKSGAFNKEVSPAMVAIVIVVVVLVVGGIYFLTQRSSDGHLPEGGATGPKIGGRRLPGAAGLGGGGGAPAGGTNAPNAPSAGTQGPE